MCLQDIEDYYDTTVDIIDHNQRLLSMAADNPHGARLFSSGRVVILRDVVSKRRFVRRFDRRPEGLTKSSLHPIAFQFERRGAAQTRTGSGFRRNQDVLGPGGRGFPHQVREEW